MSRRKPTLSRDWQTFLRIPRQSTSDAAPVLDPAWCTLRGVNPDSVAVLRLLRDEVLPLVRFLQREHMLDGFHFLVHDRESGVPVEAEPGEYVHLRLFLSHSEDLPTVLASNARYFGKFIMTRPSVSSPGAPAGLDLKLLKKKSIGEVHRLINAQSAWVLALIDAHEWIDDADMVRQVLQYGHYFSNMLQMAFR